MDFLTLLVLMRWSDALTVWDEVFPSASRRDLAAYFSLAREAQERLYPHHSRMVPYYRVRGNAVRSFTYSPHSIIGVRGPQYKRFEHPSVHGRVEVEVRTWVGRRTIGIKKRVPEFGLVTADYPDFSLELRPRVNDDTTLTLMGFVKASGRREPFILRVRQNDLGLLSPQGASTGETALRVRRGMRPYPTPVFGLPVGIVRPRARAISYPVTVELRACVPGQLQNGP